MKKVISFSAIVFMVIAMFSCSNDSKESSKPYVLPEVVISASSADKDLNGDFNAHHPELKPGERFLTNIFELSLNEDGIMISTTLEEEARSIGCKTKRVGKVAYDISGEILPGARPVFISTTEKPLEK